MIIKKFKKIKYFLNRNFIRFCEIWRKKAEIELLLKKGEEIVISGMSGRFPESDSTDEFANNLYNKVDMITDDNRRWPNGDKNVLNFDKEKIIFSTLIYTVK